MCSAKGKTCVDVENSVMLMLVHNNKKNRVEGVGGRMIFFYTFSGWMLFELSMENPRDTGNFLIF